VLDQFQYLYTTSGNVYDPTGRLRREIDSAARTREFTYNLHSELLGDTHPDHGAISYTYSANGNRLTKASGGTTTWYGYDSQNRLLWTNNAGNFAPTGNQAQPYRIYQYDANGHPTNLQHRDPGQGVTQDRYDWDGARKLRRILCVGANQERYQAKYDGGGTRLWAKLDGVDHTYSYGAGLLHDSSGNTVYTPGFSQRKGGTDAFFHTDWIGSTRYLTAGNGLGIPTGYRFDAFGNQSAGAGIDQTSLKFAGAWGYQSDVAMHLQLLGARYYDPEVGRFLSPDPIGFLDGLNLYAYCGNNPVSKVDPTGLFGDETVLAALRTGRHEVSERDSAVAAFLFGLADPGIGAVTGRNPVSGDRLTWKQQVSTGIFAIGPLKIFKFARKAQRVRPSGPTCNGPSKKLTEDESKVFRDKARNLWEEWSGRPASAEGLDIHHRVPLEWAHLMPGDPNRPANLIGVRPEVHWQINGEWTKFRNSLGGRSPTPSEIMQKALEIDRKFANQMYFLP
jgi:RHS repeat-associated protein